MKLQIMLSKKVLLLLLLLFLSHTSLLFAYEKVIFHADVGFQNWQIDNISLKEINASGIDLGIGMSSFTSGINPNNKGFSLGFTGNVYVLTNAFFESSDTQNFYIDLAFLLGLGSVVRVWKGGLLSLALGVDTAFSLGGRGIWQFGIGAETYLSQEIVKNGPSLVIGGYFLTLPLQLFSPINDVNRYCANGFAGISFH